jgi:CBS-domain-containing membrane protein
MSRPDPTDPFARKTSSGIRLRPELIDALPPAAWAAPVAEAMEPVAFTVEPEIDLVDVLKLLVRHGAHAAPVVEESGRLLGVVSKADVLLELCGEPQPEEDGRRLTRGPAAVDFGPQPGRSVRDFMAERVMVIDEDMPIAHAAAMIARGIHPVPIVDASGRCTGMLSSIDVLRWLARNDRS